MNLFEKLNRLDDNKSLAESTKMVTKKKLTEGYRVEPKSSEFNVGDKVAERYNDSEFNVGTIIEIKKDAEGTQYLVKWDYSDRDDEEWLYGDVLSLWVEDETEDAHDDNIDEMLTESTEQYELSTLVKDSINHLVNDLSKDPMADDFEDDVCADLENNYDIYVPQNPVKYADWCDAVMNEVSRQLNKDEELTENRHSHYSAPYGYKDAAKVLNRKAPEYYYQCDEIQMAEGDGIKLARYALKKGLPVMIYKYSDPDYPEFAIRGEYHWDDYFYFDPTPHEEDFIAWDGKMLVEEQLTESCEYTVKRYGEWHWGIIGPDKLLLRQDNGKLLLFKSKDKAVAYIDTLCKNTLTEGNNVSSHLPPAVDDFLQDIAQMYRTITYKDIIEHKYTEDDLKKLRNYRRRFRAESLYEGDEEADAILNDIAEKVALIIKR